MVLWVEPEGNGPDMPRVDVEDTGCNTAGPRGVYPFEGIDVFVCEIAIVLSSSKASSSSVGTERLGWGGRGRLDEWEDWRD